MGQVFWARELTANAPLSDCKLRNTITTDGSQGKMLWRTDAASSMRWCIAEPALKLSLYGFHFMISVQVNDEASLMRCVLPA
jgi:hypothetical protein